MPSFAMHVLSIALCLSSGFQQASILNQPYLQIQQFINSSWMDHYGTELASGTLSVMWSLLNVMFPVATIVGQFLAAWLCARFGRKMTALVSTALYIPGTLLCFFSYYVNAFELLYVGRFLWSTANGISTVTAAVWVVECAPARHRGGQASLQEFFMAVGSVIAQAVGVPFSTDTLWPMIFLPNVIVSIASFFMLCFVYESPQFIIEREKDVEKARLALAAYYGTNSDDESIDAELRVCEEAIERKQKAAEIAKNVKTQAAGVELQYSTLTIIFNPFKARDPMSKLIRFGAWVGVMVKIAYVFTGARSLRSYSTFVLYQMSGWSYNAALWMSFSTGVIRVPITLIPVFIVDRVGRRPLMIGSMFITIVFLTVMSAGILFGGAGKIAAMVGLTGVLIINACGLGSVSRFYAAELVPRNVLLNAMSVLTVFEALSKIGAEFAWYPIANMIGAWSMLIFLAPCILFLVLTWRYCPETAKKSVNEVLNEMARKRDLKVSFTV